MTRSTEHDIEWLDLLKNNGYRYPIIFNDSWPRLLHLLNKVLEPNERDLFINMIRKKAELGESGIPRFSGERSREVNVNLYIGVATWFYMDREVAPEICTKIDKSIYKIRNYLRYGTYSKYTPPFKGDIPDMLRSMRVPDVIDKCWDPLTRILAILERVYGNKTGNIKKSISKYLRTNKWLDPSVFQYNEHQAHAPVYSNYNIFRHFISDGGARPLSPYMKKIHNDIERYINYGYL